MVVASRRYGQAGEPSGPVLALGPVAVLAIAPAPALLLREPATTLDVEPAQELGVVVGRERPGHRRVRQLARPAGHEPQDGPDDGHEDDENHRGAGQQAHARPVAAPAVDERVDRDPDHHEDHNHAEQHAHTVRRCRPAGRGRAWTFRRLPTARSQEPERRDRTVIRP